MIETILCLLLAAVIGNSVMLYLVLRENPRAPESLRPANPFTPIAKAVAKKAWTRKEKTAPKVNDDQKAYQIERAAR